MASTAEFLAATPLLAGSPASAIAELAAASATRRYRKGELLCRQGELGTSTLVVSSGAAKLTVTSPSGDETTVGVVGAGDAFGELAALDGGPRSATAVALETTTVVVVPADVLRRVVAANPKVADAVIRSLVSLVRRTTVQRCDLVFRDVTARVVSVLLERSANDGTVRPTLTQTELAQLAGGTRQTVNQVIHSLEAGEAIRLSGRTITVLDRAALERRLGD